MDTVISSVQDQTPEGLQGVLPRRSVVSQEEEYGRLR